jgi:hypothetical protein
MRSLLPTLLRHPTTALLTAAVAFAGSGVFYLLAHPATEGTLSTYKEYVLTAGLFPAALGTLWALVALDALRGGPAGRLGRTGLAIAAVGLVALAAISIVTMASGTTESTGPLYPIGMIATFAGISLLAVEWYRRGALRRWMGIALAAGWFVGATPLLGGGGLLVFAAALLAVSVGLRRPSTGTAAVRAAQ